jgi:NADPH-dependent 2,4-dienoyl-CoA reductase/sulfur reductase-like enzyme
LDWNHYFDIKGIEMAGRILSGIKPLKLVMVGGVAGGATAAARARRVSELSQILMFERGPDISVASCGLPYHVSGEIADRSRLVMSTPQHLRETLAVDVRTQHEVVGINRKEKTIDVCNLALPQGSVGSKFQVPYDKLLLGTGAIPIVPPIPGLAEGTKSGRIFTLRSLEDMDSIIKRIKSNCQQNKQVVVIGAGLVGLEMVEALSRVGLAVTIVEDRDHVAPLFDKEISAPMADEMTANGVRVMASSRVVAFHDQPANNLIGVELLSGETLEASMVVQNIGVRPASSLAVAAGLAVDKRSAIIVNPFMQTSDSDIYAVGDVASTPFCPVGKPSWLPLGGPANRMARIAADHMLLGDARTDPYRGSFGTCIVRVFDSVAGKTGLTENGTY